MFHWINIFNTASNNFMFSWVCYPVLGALLVPFASFLYYHLYHYRTDTSKPYFKHEPSISIFVPAHNEHADLAKTVTYLATKLNYRRYEIIIIDDGSCDDTPQLADQLAKKYHRVRVIHVTQNAGKAHGYNVALAFARGDFIFSNDADTLPEPDCLWKYMNYFVGRKHQNVGAVTGNMNILNRSKSIEKAQLTEYTSIIGNIKRAQSAYAGTQYAFSGACLMVRKDALIDCGGFSQSLDTEDIDLTWRMSRNCWESLFAPDIFSYLIVPVNTRQLIKQRKRWAAGGTEVWLRAFKLIFLHPWRMRQKLPIFIDATASNTWSVLYWILLALFLWFNIYDWWTGDYTDWKYMWLFTLVIICFEYLLGTIQILVSLHYDDRGKKMHYFFFCYMYLTFTWLVNPLTVLITIPKAIRVVLSRHHKNTWSSPR